MVYFFQLWKSNSTEHNESAIKFGHFDMTAMDIEDGMPDDTGEKGDYGMGPTGGTTRLQFPVPTEFESVSAAQQRAAQEAMIGREVGVLYEKPGRMPGQMASFLDQAGGLWARGALHGKVGGAFTSTATQHGGQEVTLFSIITNLMHFGMVIVGLPYSHAGQMTLDEIVGGSPYGATTIAGGQGQRQPSAIELDGARHQGQLIAQTANRLFAH